MSTWHVRVEVVTLYTIVVEASSEDAALAIAENASPHMLRSTYDEDECSVTPLSAECDGDDTCQSCNGCGGGEDAALRCSTCRGSGTVATREDDREPEEREPREYGGSRDPE